MIPPLLGADHRQTDEVNQYVWPGNMPVSTMDKQGEGSYEEAICQSSVLPYSI